MAWHASQLGLTGYVASRLGRDDDGRALRAELEGRGLDLRYVQEDPSLPTGTVDVDLADVQAPRYTIRHPAAWDAFEVEAPLQDLAGHAAAVCYGTLFQRTRRSRESLHTFLRAATGALRLYDVSFRQEYYDRAWIGPSLEAADAVKLNELEVVEMARVLGVKPPAPEDLARHLEERFRVAVTCVTRGERGCLLITGDELVDMPGHPVRVADTVGAGDAFSAAFLAARLVGASLTDTARFANAVGALVASREGAMPRLADEYAALGARILGAPLTSAGRSRR